MKTAVELVNDIGSKAFILQHHSDADIAEAVKVLRGVNGPMFDWLVTTLESAKAAPAVVTQGADHHEPTTRVGESSSALTQAEVGLRATLEFALAHVEELRDAWQRGVLQEHDGQGGIRSNRNIEVESALRAVLLLLREKKDDDDQSRVDMKRRAAGPTGSIAPTNEKAAGE